MAHFAKLDSNNVVVFVTVGRDEDNGKEDELTARTGDVYKQTSYNTRGGVHILGETPFRKNYAGLGYIYDATRDAFIPPQPYQSWLLNENTCLWDSPIAMPDDGYLYSWVEATKDWVLVVENGQAIKA
jgi:hypothetical protein